MFEALEPGYPTQAETRLRVAAFDVGTGQDVGSFVIGSGVPIRVRLSGSRIYVNFGQALWSYNLDGSGARELWGRPGTWLGAFALSPSGDRIAFERCDLTQCGQTRAHAIEIVAASDGREIRSVSQTAATFPGFRGDASPVRWLSENELLVEGLTYSEGGGGSAVVAVDGSVRVLDGTHLVDPGATLQVERSGGFGGGCALGPYDPARRVVLVDPASGAALNAIQRDLPTFEFTEVSPGEDTVLVAERLLSPPTEAAERRLLAAPGTCPDMQFARAVESDPLQWLLLPTSGGPPTPVASRIAVHRSWYGDRAVTFVCADEEHSAFYLDGEALVPEGIAIGFAAPACTAPTATIEISVGDTTVGVGIHPVVLGFIDRPGGAGTPAGAGT